MASKKRFDRILIIATRQIGDVLCTTPLMRRAREIWPEAVIDVLGYERTMGMLAGNPDINEVIESPEHPRWPEYRELITRIFRRYDLAIVTQPSDRAHIYGLLAAPKRVGIVPTSKSHSWWKRLFSLHTVQLDYWRNHVVLERLRLLEAFGEGYTPPTFGRAVSLVPPSPVPLPGWLDQFIKVAPTIVVHATPMWRFKRWPTEHWAHLISELLSSGWQVCLTGSSSHEDVELNNQIMNRVKDSDLRGWSPPVRNCSGILSLGQTTRLLQLVDCYIGVDTSITHLAAACGTETIALFGPTPPTNFGPWPLEFEYAGRDRTIWGLGGGGAGTTVVAQRKKNVLIVQGPGDCVPCRRAGCENDFNSKSDCLDRLTPEAVIRFLPLAKKSAHKRIDLRNEQMGPMDVFET